MILYIFICLAIVLYFLYIALWLIGTFAFKVIPRILLKWMVGICLLVDLVSVGPFILIYFLII